MHASDRDLDIDDDDALDGGPVDPFTADGNEYTLVHRNDVDALRIALEQYSNHQPAAAVGLLVAVRRLDDNADH